MEYARLAHRVSEVLPRRRLRLAEMGCGDGRLTIPLARAMPSAQLTAIDSFRGPYRKSRRELSRRVGRAGLSRRVEVVSQDGLRWLERQRPESLDAIVSSEFLPELTSKELASFFAGSFRATRDGGLAVHIFLSPRARNPAQRLVIRADSDPRWNRHPSREWFSPPPTLVESALGEVGFRQVRFRNVRSRLRFVGTAASAQLRSWRVRAAFGRRHLSRPEAGIELPDWIIAQGQR